MSRGAWATAALFGASALLVLGGLGVGDALRAVVGTALVGVAPGWATLRHIALDPLERIVLAVAVSLALATSVAAVLMYVGWWSPARAVTIIATVTMAEGGFERSRAIVQYRNRRR